MIPPAGSAHGSQVKHKRGQGLSAGASRQTCGRRAQSRRLSAAVNAPTADSARRRARVRHAEPRRVRHPETRWPTTRSPRRRRACSRRTPSTGRCSSRRDATCRKLCSRRSRATITSRPALPTPARPRRRRGWSRRRRGRRVDIPRRRVSRQAPRGYSAGTSRRRGCDVHQPDAQVTAIHFEMTKWDDAQCEALARFGLPPRATELYLMRNAITHRGIASLARLLPASRLRSLNLSCNPLLSSGGAWNYSTWLESESAFRALGSSIPPTLETLNLNETETAKESGDPQTEVLVEALATRRRKTGRRLKVLYIRGADIPRTGRGDAAAVAWTFRGDRGWDVDIQWRRVAATPRLPRGHSVGTAAGTWIFNGDGSRRRCGCRVDISWGRVAAATTFGRSRRAPQVPAGQ